VAVNIELCVVEMRRQINETVFQQLQISQLFSAVIHSFKGHEHVMVVIHLMNIEHQLLSNLFIQALNTGDALVVVQLFQADCKKILGIFKILRIISFFD